MEKNTKTSKINKAKKAASGRNKDIKEIAKKAIKELERIAFSDEEPVKIRMDILKWFTEMEIGKPKSHTESEETADNSFDIRICVEE